MNATLQYPTHTLKSLTRSLQILGYAIGYAPDNDTYHAWKRQLGIPCISASTLNDYAKSPYAYHLTADTPKEKTDAMLLGSAIDLLCTGTRAAYNAKFKGEADFKRAVKKDGTPYANNVQDPAQKAEWAAAGITFMPAAIPELASQNILAEWEKHYPHRFHQLCIWVKLKQVDGIPLASELVLCGALDLLSQPAENRLEIVDLKSTSEDVTDTRALRRAAEKRHYARQLAIYRALVAAVYPHISDISASLHFVSTTAPCLTRLMHAMPETLADAWSETRDLILNYAESVATGNWGTPALPPAEL